MHDKDVEIQKYFSDLLPHLIVIIAESIEEQNDQTLIKLLIDMAENVPKYLRPQLESIFEVCMKVFSSTDVEESWRHLALEVMVSLAENAAPMVRKKAEKYVQALVPLVLVSYLYILIYLYLKPLVKGSKYKLEGELF